MAFKFTVYKDIFAATIHFFVLAGIKPVEAYYGPKICKIKQNNQFSYQFLSSFINIEDAVGGLCFIKLIFPVRLESDCIDDDQFCLVADITRRKKVLDETVTFILDDSVDSF